MNWKVAGSELAEATVQAFAIAPQTPNTMYAGANEWVPGSGYAGKVLKSADGGTSWHSVGAGLPKKRIHALAVHPQNSDVLYAGTESGVFRSTDGGAKWTEANSGLTTPDVQTIAVDPKTPARLFAGTAGGGVFEMTFSP
jgi:photosystem II stability/assembly factor-like uncharacterized protein